jgi:predicted nucleotidyltransferase
MLVFIFSLLIGLSIGGGLRAARKNSMSPHPPQASGERCSGDTCYPAEEMSPPENIPADLSELLQAITADFPALLRENLVGVYLWGSLTYDAFDETCSDVDCIVVTRRDLDAREFAELDAWFTKTGQRNPWVHRLDMRFVIDREFLDKNSRCCGFYHYTAKLVRHGSDGNPIIWINIAQCGVTLYGKDAQRIAPQVSERCFNEALLLELSYLRGGLRSRTGDRSNQAFVYNAYAVLTACRILYSAYHRTLVSKERASGWALQTVPTIWHQIIRGAQENRQKNAGATTPQLEDDATRFLEFVANEVTPRLS